MSKKTLYFDATEVKTTARNGGYVNVEIETDYPNEVLDCFTAEEIIQEYADLEELFEALKEHFE